MKKLIVVFTVAVMVLALVTPAVHAQAENHLYVNGAPMVTLNPEEQLRVKGVAGQIHAYDALLPAPGGLADHVHVWVDGQINANGDSGWIQAGIIRGEGIGGTFATGGKIMAYVEWGLQPQHGGHDYIFVGEVAAGTDHHFRIERVQSPDPLIYPWRVYVDGEVVVRNGQPLEFETSQHEDAPTIAEKESLDWSDPPDNQVKGWFGQLKYATSVGPQWPGSWSSWYPSKLFSNSPYGYIEQAGYQERGTSEPQFLPKYDEFFASGPREPIPGQPPFETVFPVGWNMFAFPVKPDPHTWPDQLGDDFQPSFWVYHFNPVTGGYMQLQSPTNPGLFLPQLGQGYWVRVYPPNSINVDATGFSIPDDATEHDFAIHLLPGWNQIGHPYNFPVRLDNAKVRLVNTTESLVQAHLDGWLSKFLYYYDPSAGSYRITIPDGIGSDELQSWRGYWIKSYSWVDLLIPPIDATGLSPGGLQLTSQLLWSAQLSGASSSVSDVDNHASVAVDASEQYDSNDAPEPPMGPSPAMRLYFPHADWPQNPGDYTQDVRPSAGAITWDFEVQASFRSLTTLTWDVSQVPTSYTTVQLLDGSGNVLVSDMRTTSQYQYTPPYSWAITAFKFKVS